MAENGRAAEDGKEEEWGVMKRREFLQGIGAAVVGLVVGKGKAKPPEMTASAAFDELIRGIEKPLPEPEMLFGRPIVYTDALPDIGGDIVLGDLSAYIEGSLIKRIPVSQEILDDCIAGGDAWRGVRLSGFERTILDGDA